MNEVELLKKQVVELLAWKNSLENSFKIPLNFQQSLQGRKFARIGTPYSNSMIDASDPNNTLRNDRTVTVSIGAGGGSDDFQILDFPFRWAEYMEGSKLYIPLYPFRE